MGDDVQDTLNYRVNLDTQGLAQQLASVRDTVTSGLVQAGQTMAGAGAIVSGASNRLTSDLMQGQQFVAAALPSQFMMAPQGAAQSTLAQLPGMPQSFGQEIMAATGITRAPVGVFPSQFQAVAAQRINERLQMGATAVAAGGVSMAAGMVGAAIGQAVIPIPFVGGFVGGLAGQMLGDTAMAPVINTVQEHMMERARVSQIFGFNKFSHDQQVGLAGWMRQQTVKSIMSPDEFNNVLPAAVRGGFFQGVGRGDSAGARHAFSAAREAIGEAMFSLQLSGAEGVTEAGRQFGGMNLLGARGQDASRMFMRSQVLARDMAELGQFVDPLQVQQQTMEVGQMGAAAGIAPGAAMETFGVQAYGINRMLLPSNRKMSEADLAIMGGTSAAAAERMTGALIQSQRMPVGRMLAMAFTSVDKSGKIVADRAALDQMAAGKMNASDMAQRIAEKLDGPGGLEKMAQLIANPQQANAALLPEQAMLMKQFSASMAQESGLGKEFQQIAMQKLFGADEATSRTLMADAPMDAADRKRLEKDTQKMSLDVKEAQRVAGTGLAHELGTEIRSTKELLGGYLDKMTRYFSDAIGPDIKASRAHLESMEHRLRGTEVTGRAKSPISMGSIDFSHSDGKWMIPADPTSFQGFRAVSDSMMNRLTPMVSMQVKPPHLQDARNLSRLVGPLETMAG